MRAASPIAFKKWGQGLRGLGLSLGASSLRPRASEGRPWAKKSPRLSRRAQGSPPARRKRRNKAKGMVGVKRRAFLGKRQTQRRALLTKEKRVVSMGMKFFTKMLEAARVKDSRR